MKKKLLFITLILALFTAGLSYAQLSVAPTPIFIDDQTNASTFYVSNRNDTPQEIRIELQFGYVVTDSLGNRSVAYDDPHNLSEYNLSEMVRVFPRQFVLAGNQQRTVRVQVIPRQDMAEGTYFTRLRVISEEAGRDLEDIEAVGEGELVTRINYRFEQGFSMVYRRGNVDTNVEVAGLRLVEEEDAYAFIAELVRSGNSGFSGSMRFELLSNAGEVVSDQRVVVGALTRDFNRVRVNRGEVTPGSYTARITLESDRADINPRNLVRITPVTYEQIVLIP